jgi:hypothetical protein
MASDNTLMNPDFSIKDILRGSIENSLNENDKYPPT